MIGNKKDLLNLETSSGGSIPDNPTEVRKGLDLYYSEVRKITSKSNDLVFFNYHPSKNPTIVNLGEYTYVDPNNQTFKGIRYKMTITEQLSQRNINVHDLNFMMAFCLFDVDCFKYYNDILLGDDNSDVHFVDSGDDAYGKFDLRNGLFYIEQVEYIKEDDSLYLYFIFLESGDGTLQNIDDYIDYGFYIVPNVELIYNDIFYNDIPEEYIQRVLDKKEYVFECYSFDPEGDMFLGDNRYLLFLQGSTPEPILFDDFYNIVRGKNNKIFIKDPNNILHSVFIKEDVLGEIPRDDYVIFSNLLFDKPINISPSSNYSFSDCLLYFNIEYNKAQDPRDPQKFYASVSLIPNIIDGNICLNFRHDKDSNACYFYGVNGIPANMLTDIDIVRDYLSNVLERTNHNSMGLTYSKGKVMASFETNSNSLEMNIFDTYLLAAKQVSVPFKEEGKFCPIFLPLEDVHIYNPS